MEPGESGWGYTDRERRAMARSDFLYGMKGFTMTQARGKTKHCYGLKDGETVVAFRSKADRDTWLWSGSKPYGHHPSHRQALDRPCAVKMVKPNGRGRAYRLYGLPILEERGPGHWVEAGKIGEPGVPGPPQSHRGELVYIGESSNCDTMAQPLQNDRAECPVQESWKRVTHWLKPERSGDTRG